MKKISLRKAIEIFGGENIQLFSGYCYQYGFFEKGGQLFYINSGDIRSRRPDGQLNVMYRAAEHRKDWTGGVNQWDFVRKINISGFEVTTCRCKTGSN